MPQVAEPEIGRAGSIMRAVLWFLIGLASSAALIVVIPPLIVGLLLVFVVTTMTIRIRTGRFQPRATAMLLGVTALSIYVLIWALTLASSNVSSIRRQVWE